MTRFVLKIKEEGGCELYNIYKIQDGSTKEEYVMHVYGNEGIYIDFDNKEVLINGVRIFKEEKIE